MPQFAYTAYTTYADTLLSRKMSYINGHLTHLNGLNAYVRSLSAHMYHGFHAHILLLSGVV